MPRYRFTGNDETVLMGLSHGVNAELHRDDHGQPDGSTVVALPGDEVSTVERYPHMLMVDVDTEQPSALPIGEQGPELRSVPAGTVVHSHADTAAAVARANSRPPRQRKPRVPKPPKPVQNPPATEDPTTDPEGEE